METFEAMYEKGKLKFKRKPKIEKGKVLVTFLTSTEKQETSFPVKSLGKIKNIDRSGLYDEYLSTRY
jgi:predicted DNA-binding antitoxin AbrB/MazE fold protein